MFNAPPTLWGPPLTWTQIAQAIRDVFPEVKIGRKDNEHVARVASRVDPKLGRIDFSYSPSYCEKRHFAAQKLGMENAFAQFSPSPAQRRVLAMIRGFGFCLSVSFEPDCTVEDDPRLAWMERVMHRLDAVLFLPWCFCDPHLFVLYDPESGESSPQATWPVWVPLSDGVDANNDDAVDDSIDEEKSTPSYVPDAIRVAKRMVALLLVADRGLVEQEQGADRESIRSAWRETLQWAVENHLTKELEPAEKQLLKAKIGGLDRQQIINAVWRLEGAVVLAWALRLFRLPPPDQVVDVPELFASVHYSNPRVRTLLAKPSLREHSELVRKKIELTAIHWRLREFDLRPVPLDMTQFAKTGWLGPFDIGPIPLQRNDLAIAGKPIAQADPASRQLTLSIAMERHTAINWVCGGYTLYSDTPAHT